MKKVLVFLALSISFQSSAQKKWSLKDCVDYALEHNISVKQSQNTLLLNDQDIISAEGNFMPSFGVGASQSLSLGNVEVFEGNFLNRTFNSTNLGLNVSQDIFNGFRNLNIYKQANANKEVSQLQLDLIKDNISLNIINAYLNILFNHENLETAKSQYAFSENQLERVKALVDAGVQPQANIFDAEATFSSNAQQLTLAQNNYDLALLSLAQLLQIPSQAFEVEIIDVGTPSIGLLYDDVNFIVNYALDNRKEIKSAEKSLEASELATKISESGYYPNLSFGYGFNTGANFSNLSEDNSFFQQINDNIGHSFSLRLNIPIFSRYQNRTAVSKAKIQEANSQLNLNQAKLDLENNIQRAYTDAKAALKTYEAALKTIQARQTAFDNAQERYSIGALNAFDLEQTRVQLVDAQTSLTNAKYDFVFKTKVLDFYMGKPIIP